MLSKICGTLAGRQQLASLHEALKKAGIDTKQLAEAIHIVTGPIGRFVSQNLQTAARAFECRKIATDPVGSLRYTFDSATCAALGGTVGSAVMVPAGTPVVTP
jgi:hypothetical protein